MSPKVSILIPVFNSALFLQEMLDSLRAQSFKDYEAIFIMDPCTDNSWAILEHNRKLLPACLVIQTEQRQGLPASLNLGLAQSQGEYIFRLDTDDLLRPDCLAKMVSFLEEHGYDGVTCDELKIDEHGQPKYMLLKLKADYYIKKQNLFRTAYGGPTTLIKKTKILEAGGWDARMNISDDKRLALKLHKITTLGHVAERLYLYREHGNNMSQKIFKQKQGTAYQKIMSEYTAIFEPADYINDWTMIKNFTSIKADYALERTIKYANVVLRCAIKLAQYGKKKAALEEIEKAEYLAPLTNFFIFKLFIALGFKKYLDILYVNMNIWTKYAYDDFYLVDVKK